MAGEKGTAVLLSPRLLRDEPPDTALRALLEVASEVP